jgi:hypothetical protein
MVWVWRPVAALDPGTVPVAAPADAHGWLDQAPLGRGCQPEWSVGVPGPVGPGPVLAGPAGGTWLHAGDAADPG